MKNVAMFPITIPNPQCKYEIEWETEELRALMWLNGVLRKIMSKDGPSKDKAYHCMIGIGKLTSYEEKMHNLFHDMEKKLKAKDSELHDLRRRCESLELVIADDELCTDGSCLKCRGGEPCH